MTEEWRIALDLTPLLCTKVVVTLIHVAEKAVSSTYAVLRRTVPENPRQGPKLDMETVGELPALAASTQDDNRERREKTTGWKHSL